VSARSKQSAKPAASKNDPLARDVQRLVDLLRQHELSELEVEQKGLRIRVRRGQGGDTIHAEMPRQATPAQPEAAETVAEPDIDPNSLVTVTSPIVGTFYRSPSPDADPYVEEGDVVKKGQVLCIVEAMKLMNEIEAETDGKIHKNLAETSKPVEYGQPLFLIDPTATA
jgi:acetyl-CoA carboxylase biotin carboxyl carrier protein